MANITHSLAHKLDGTHWATAVVAAFIAGAVFLVLQMSLVALASDNSPMQMARMVAAIALGRSVLYEQGFDFLVLLTALLIHFGLAVLFAWILAPLIQFTTVPVGIAAGLAFGIMLYLVDFFLGTAAFPWFANARGWAMLVSHLVFGAVLAWSYLRLSTPQRRLAY